MKVYIFSTKLYDRQFFTAANTQHQHELTFLEARLDRQTACLATNATAVCVFVNDEVDLNTLDVLAKSGVNLNDLLNRLNSFCNALEISYKYKPSNFTVQRINV